MDTLDVQVQDRQHVGTSHSRRLRKQGIVPAIFYKGSQAIPLAIPEKELRSVTGKKKGIVLLRLKGERFTHDAYALLKEIQWHPYRNQILHVDLQGVDLDEEIDVLIPLHFEGQPVGIKQGGVLEILAHEIRVRVKVKEIPPFIPVELSSLTLGAVLHARDLKLPEGIRFLGDPGMPLAHVATPTKEEATTQEGEALSSEATAPQPASTQEAGKEAAQKPPASEKGEKKGKK